MSEEELKKSAMGRFEWFVVHMLHKLTRADIDQALDYTRNATTESDDSYARHVVYALVGDWNFQRHVDALVGDRHSGLLAELDETKKKLRRAESTLSSCEYQADELRKLADRLDPPKKDEP